MVFVPKTWVDGSGGGTPITAAELNRIEQGIVGAYGDITSNGLMRYIALHSDNSIHALDPITMLTTNSHATDTGSLLNTLIGGGVKHFVFGPGDFPLTTTISLVGGGFSLRGTYGGSTNLWRTRLYQPTNANLSALIQTSVYATATVDGLYMADLLIDGNVANQSTALTQAVSGIRTPVNYGYFLNCFIVRCYKGLELSPHESPAGSPLVNIVKGCHFYDNRWVGLSSGTDGLITDNWFGQNGGGDNSAGSNAPYYASGIYQQGGGNRVEGNHLYNNWVQIYHHFSNAHIISDNIMEACVRQAIVFDGQGHECVMTGNRMSANLGGFASGGNVPQNYPAIEYISQASNGGVKNVVISNNMFTGKGALGTGTTADQFASAVKGDPAATGNIINYFSVTGNFWRGMTAPTSNLGANSVIANNLA